MTCRAVVAAMRPKPAGVSSYSRNTFPSGPTSCANTVTSPVRRSSTTRACSCAPTGRGDLQHVRRVAHHVVRVECSAELSTDAGDGVEVKPAIAVDDDAQQSPLAGPLDLDALEVITGGRRDRSECGRHGLGQLGLS